MKLILTITQIIISVLLVIGVLLQQRGSAIGSAFGFEGGSSYGTRRGIQRKIYLLTVILGILFIAISLLTLVLS